MAQQSESGGLLADPEVEPYLYAPYYTDERRDPNNNPQSQQVQREQIIQRKPAPAVTNVEIQPVSSTDTVYKAISESDAGSAGGPSPNYGSVGNVWSPGVWQRFPYRGILALCGCIGCVVASIVVLVVSDGEPIDDWVLSPTVYLAFLMAGTNMLARFAFNEGVKIAWWRKVLRGSTVKDLHAQWAHADGFWEAVFCGRQFNLVALASIAVTVIVVDQPLIQRASTVVTVQRTAPVNITAHIAPEIPWGFTGFQNGRVNSQQVMTTPMISVFNDYNSQTPINVSFTGCKHTCTGYIAAAGLAAKCNTISGPIRYNFTDYSAQVVSPFSAQVSLKSPIFKEPPALNVSSQMLLQIAYTFNSNGSIENSECEGTRTERNCTLLPATVRYPVTIVNGSILTLEDIVNNATVVSLQPPSTSFQVDGYGDYAHWTMGGLYLAIRSLFVSNATYTFGGAIGIYPTLPDTLSNQFLEISAPGNLSASTSLIPIPESCALSWTDPTSHILRSINEMAFRLSLAAKDFPYRDTNTSSAPQSLTMLQTTDVNVFRSEYRFLIASTVLTTVFILLITPTFIGWWELGRRVTLNPIETAKAFDAPVLQGPGSNAPLSELVRTMGGRGLKLGVVDGYVPGSMVKKQLKIADPVEVARPRAGGAYA
ncbi:hypothetical protein F5884DRAFT_115560 [Xylogone sp. PMI_703]|nr:hypothetical protein F5884DRAFT_115560 [Xylogone sp. PMI_703]